MPCAICRRQARGFLWQDPSYCQTKTQAEGGEKSRPETAAFCSFRCQTLFGAIRKSREARYRWAEAPEDKVIDASDTERAAMAAALRPLGDYVVAVGVERPLAAYSREEIVTLIELVIDAYQAHLLEVAEREAAREDALFRRLEARRQSMPPKGVPF